MTYMVDPRIRWVKRTPTGWILYHPSRHFVQISSQQSAVLLKVALDRVDSTGLDSEDYRVCQHGFDRGKSDRGC